MMMTEMTSCFLCVSSPIRGGRSCKVCNDAKGKCWGDFDLKLSYTFLNVDWENPT